MTESTNASYSSTDTSIPRESSSRNGQTSSDLPKEQQSEMEADDEEFEFFHQFEREKVKGVIHLITVELKERATDVEFLMIPFRPQQTNEGLLKFLNAMFPLGNGQPVAEARQKKLVANTNVHTLFQGLKYVWSRLQDGEVVGWKSYLQFKFREKSKSYPKKAFLELMPQCLESPSHASIVYDFFDLIVTISANSRVNKMSARKTSKMFAIWAFGRHVPDPSVADYDFDEKAFLKSFVPEDLESAQLPRTLKSLLFNNEYPPEKSTVYTSETILTIPLVTLETDTFSRKPWELLERCNGKLDFSNYEAFEAREDYALLKSLFKKKNNVEGISRKMSQESRRLMKEMSTKHSTFQAGWAPRKCVPNYEGLSEEITVKRVDIDDYFIWTWLSTLSHEQTSERKKIFGRSLILEFEFDGFKKWVLFQESDVVLERQKRGRRNKQEHNDSRVSSNASSKESANEKPLAKVPKTRNVTPTYEKFQKQVSQEPPEKRDAINEAYHTVISRDTLEKNNGKHNVNLHLLEQKISSFWNPLHKGKKKNKPPSQHTSSEIREITNTAALPRELHQKGGKNAIPEEVAARAPNTPPDSLVEETLEPAKPLHSPQGHDPKRAMEGEKTTPDETIKELKGIVDDMMAEDGSATITSEMETFETLTKFDQYKPSRLSDTEPPSAASTVPSLRVSSDDDGRKSPSVGPGPPPASHHSHEYSESSSYYETPTSAHGPSDPYRQQRPHPVTPHAKTAGGNGARPPEPNQQSASRAARQTPAAAKPFKQSPTPHGALPNGALPNGATPHGALPPGNSMLYYKTPRSDPQLVPGRAAAGSMSPGGNAAYAGAVPPAREGLPRSGYSQPALHQIAHDIPSSPSHAMLNPYKPAAAERSPRPRVGPMGPMGPMGAAAPAAPAGAAAHHQGALPYAPHAPHAAHALPSTRNSHPVVPQVVPQQVPYLGSASPQMPASQGMPSPQMRQQRSPQMHSQASPQMAYGFGYPRHSYGRPPGAMAPGGAPAQGMPRSPSMQGPMPGAPGYYSQQPPAPQPQPPQHFAPPQGGYVPQGGYAPPQGGYAPSPAYVPVGGGHAGPGTKLHGQTNKTQERKRLHNNIRNGNFGI